jgi:manganese transport protein
MTSAAIRLLGPAFVAAVAYVDPGNFASNFAAGSQFGYRFAWALVLANAAAMLIQYCAAKLGIATGRSLPELCRDRYPRKVSAVLWIQGELVAMATDVAEFIGAAVGLDLLFRIGLPAAAAITAAVAFTMLSLRGRGYRNFELTIAALLLAVSAGFVFQLLSVGGQDGVQLLRGLVPHADGPRQITLIVAIIGATVMPHAIYLHSALMNDRITPDGERDRRILLRFSRYDCLIGLSMAGLTNLAMLCVAAALFFLPHAAVAGSLHEIFGRMSAAAGSAAASAFGFALAASGLASSAVGTYAGQVVMSGFMSWRLPLIARRAITMIPSLLIICVSATPESALIYTQVVLSFGLPFALIPLTILGSDRNVMGTLANRRTFTLTMWCITALVCGLNVYLVLLSFSS